MLRAAVLLLLALPLSGQDAYNRLRVPQGFTPVDIDATPDGAIWLTATAGQQIRVGAGDAVTAMPAPSLGSFPDTAVAPDGGIWVGAFDRLYRRDPATFALTEILLPDDDPHASRPPSNLVVEWGVDGNIWLVQGLRQSVRHACASRPAGRSMRSHCRHSRFPTGWSPPARSGFRRRTRSSASIRPARSTRSRSRTAARSLPPRRPDLDLQRQQLRALRSGDRSEPGIPLAVRAVGVGGRSQRPALARGPRQHRPSRRHDADPLPAPSLPLHPCRLPPWRPDATFTAGGRLWLLDRYSSGAIVHPPVCPVGPAPFVQLLRVDTSLLGTGETMHLVFDTAGDIPTLWTWMLLALAGMLAAAAMRIVRN